MKVRTLQIGETKNSHPNNWNTEFIVLALDDSKLDEELKIKIFFWLLEITNFLLLFSKEEYSPAKKCKEKER